jgi:hypothetical protein
MDEIVEIKRVDLSGVHSLDPVSHALEQEAQLLFVAAADKLAGRAALLALRSRVRHSFLASAGPQARRGLPRVERLMTDASAI